MDKPTARLGLEFMDDLVGQRVSARKVDHHRQRRVEILLAGREGALHVSAECIDVGFVDRHPVGDVFLERLHRFAYEDGEFFGVSLVLPAALFRQPERVGEMVQGDHGRQAAFEQAAQHVAVTLERLLVPTVGRGLDAAPLDRQAVGVLPGLGGAVEVFLPAPAPPVAGQPGFVAVEDAPSCCSQAYQLLLVLLPSTWWAAVAVPHRNPRGK